MMSDDHGASTQLPQDGGASRARRARQLFLWTTAAIVVAVLLVSHAVVQPFVMALVLAYVLTPLVAWVESRRVPRALAIIFVYVVVLGILGGSARLMAPRIAHELGNLRRELPTMGTTLREQWLPSVQRRLEAIGVNPSPQPPVENPAAPEPAFVVEPTADGGLEIHVGSGARLEPNGHGGYQLEEAAPASGEPFDPGRLLADAVAKSFTYARTNALELARIGRDILAAVSRSIFIFFITLMLAAYVMLTRERILLFFRGLVRPAGRPAFDRLLLRVDRGLSGVVRGQLIICLVNGLLSAVGFAMVDLKYWPVLALLATVLSLIPIFGAILSSVPAVALGLTQSVGVAAFVLGWILLIHQLEANVLNPKIMGDQAKIHPVLVVFSLLVGEHFFHTLGALLAVPCMSIAQSLFIHVRGELEADDPEFAGEPRPSIPPSSGSGPALAEK